MWVIILEKQKVNVHSTKSEHSGVRGFLESFLRRFRNLAFLMMLLPLVFLVILCISLSVLPGVALYQSVSVATQELHSAIHYFSLAFSLGAGFVLYGLTLIFVVPLVNFLLPFRVKPFRGIWFSLESIPWYYHNGLAYVVRYTFLEFITPSPLNILYFKMMGMKIGKGVVINTSHISDPCLITLEDHVTIGGSVTMFAHYGQKGYLIVSPVHIGKGTTIGLKASVMGGVTVGENVMVSPHTALLPKTELKDQQSA